MKMRTKLSLGLSALVLGGSMVGCTANGGGLASAGSRDAAAAAKVAARDADKARAALGRNQPAAAIAQAEAAVALMPQNAGYRALLGNAYLKGGRFDSARAAFSDVLALEPGDARAALNLALSQIALGDWRAARATLDAHGEGIQPADRGLALALAGDPAGGAQLLTGLVKAGSASPKVRQNLALALALAGEWHGARVIASADMSPDQVDRRMEEWAAFASPKSSSDQVATLLGIRPAADPGQPVALALTAPVPVAGAVEVAPQQPAPAVVTPAAVVPEIAVAPAASDPAAAPVSTMVQVAAGPSAPLLSAAVKPAKVPVTQRAATATPSKGGWFVQVGAYRNAAVARDGWRQATRRLPRLANHMPMSARFAAQGGTFYRLAFGGFSRGDADATCRRFRATGGSCFVRAGAGDQVASWAGRPVQLASR